ncbi:MAG: hypothetical protein CMB38_00645 [Euryarchaeota archaeon]|nr:hypothetical protein [Euryarchaeota archaeon]
MIAGHLGNNGPISWPGDGRFDGQYRCIHVRAEVHSRTNVAMQVNSVKANLGRDTGHKLFWKRCFEGQHRRRSRFDRQANQTKNAVCVGSNDVPPQRGRCPFPLRGPKVKRRIETVHGPIEFNAINGVPKCVGQARGKIDGSVGGHKVGLKLKRD